ncbi:MAG: DivIVA domain-containing protein [Clostridiales bacterium]|jgi:cell division initiation protein|nr:DivIVA domain-containing protein [Clostridiales bacterium]
MLTPQEVQEKTFPKAVFGGYDMAAVDDFLEPLSEDYITLYKENAVLKNKMKVLVDTVESYRSTEDAMRSILVNAQRTADQIVAEAQSKANAILSEAENTVAGKVGDLEGAIKLRESQLLTAKQNTLNYIEKMRKVYLRQLEFLDNLENLDEHKGVKNETPSEAQPQDASGSDAVPDDAPPDTVENGEALEETRRIELPEQEPEKPLNTKKAAGQESSSRPKFEFVDLQFGKDYELK